MKPTTAEAYTVIDAPPDAVYAVLADYRGGHRAIVPLEFFRSVEVRKGGVGAGTELTVTMQVMGRESVYHLVVTEPEPGRVLMESDHQAGVTTTFTVSPIEDGKRSRVRIATEWEAKPGLAGLIDRIFIPPVARRIYQKELRRLSVHLQQQQE